MTVLYKQKIIEAFRDNAVKSALLIDDEYLPYELMAASFSSVMEELKQLSVAINHEESDALEQYQRRLESLYDTQTSAVSRFMYSQKAQGFVEFFHSKQLICDVENQTDTLDKEKVRKSDLIILDYHLKEAGEDNPAEYSLNLIDELSRSKHMNMVVVFTRENLDDVWLEIAATLRGSFLDSAEVFFGTGSNLLQEWRDNHSEWSVEWDLVTSKAVKEKYLKNEHDIESLFVEMQESCDQQDLAEPKREHIGFLLEKSILSYNKNKRPRSEFMVHGRNELWLQAGDIFVVLCEKRKKDDLDNWIDTTPELVWDKIQEALIDWYPSFYRVIASELQNQIEDANLSMEKVLSKKVTEQIAALWGVLRVPEAQRGQASKELLSSLLSDVVEKVQNSSGLLTFIEQTASHVSTLPLPEYVDHKENPGQHTNFLKEVLDAAKRNQKGLEITVDQEFRCSVLHAYNEQISTERELPAYISTGLILKDVEHQTYYLCIAPSCNTIPKQTTGNIAKRMTPHRPMRFIRLENKTAKLADCLKNAHQSDVIFISDGESRLALGIIPDKSDGPMIEHGVVIKHDEELIGSGSTKGVQFIDINEEKELIVITRQLKPIAKLRPGFASRYQNAQIQYEARIGVDLVSANFK